MEQILVIDQGTHASRCMLYSSNGNLLAMTKHPVSSYRQGQQIIEQNAEEILGSIYYCLDQLQQQHGLDQVKSAALVTQRSTIAGWHKHSGKLLSAAISWQDTRASDRILQLNNQQQEIKSITGLPLSPHYGASKMQWLLQHDKNCKQAFQQHNLIIAPLASYLVAQLTGNVSAVIDHVNAQRSQLLELGNLDWSEIMLKKFSLQRHCLPAVRSCLFDYGKFRHHNIPLKLVTGDQNAAIFSQGQPDKKSLVINIGTGAFVLRLTNERVNHPRLLDGIAVSSEDCVQFLQEGTVNGAGSALALLYEQLPEAELLARLPQWLEEVEKPPIFLNTVSGLGSPWWDNSLEPRFLDEEPLELAKKAVAIIESIVFLLMANIEEIKVAETDHIRISGGLARLDGLCQKLADLSQLEVSRSSDTEASANGAAWLIGDQENWLFNEAITIFVPHQNLQLRHRYQRFINTLRDELNQDTTVNAAVSPN